MDEKENRSLINRILTASRDLKGARVATSIFINKASIEEAKFFVEYMDSEDSVVRKLARFIIGQKGVVEALPKLLTMFEKEVNGITFLPEEEYKESIKYPNIIDILETIFSIVKENNIKDENLLNRSFEIFKRTKNEDLRFTLIKLICFMGDKLEFFLKFFDDLGEKEKRALYYIYSFKSDPKRMELFNKALGDDKNFEYVVANLLKFKEGRLLLNERLAFLNNFKINIVLKSMLDGSYPELEPSLLKLLDNESKYIVNLAIENLKKCVDKEFPIDQFIFFLENNYSEDMIKSSLELIEEYNKEEAFDIFLEALEKQPLIQNKSIIIEHIAEIIKKQEIADNELTSKILNIVLNYFNVYNSKRDELYISVLKLLGYLKYDKSSTVKYVKSKIIKFMKMYENSITTTLKNNISETFVKLNQIISKFEEIESKIKELEILFNIDVSKVDYDRIVKLKKQLEEIENLDEDNRIKLEEFLCKVYDFSREDWKKREISVELLGIYGDKETLKFLKDVYEKEHSLGVKLAAQSAIKNLYRNLKVLDSVLVIEKLYYINKLLKDYFESELFKVFSLKSVEEVGKIKSREYVHAFISDEFFEALDGSERDSLEKVSKSIVIVTNNPEKYLNLNNEKYSVLKKPFNKEVLESLYGSE